MPTIEEAKAMAKRLRAALASRDIAIQHSTALELVAAEMGFANWNVAAVRLESQRVQDGIRLERAIPIIRIFDEAKAREFYCEFLGFAVDFEHRFEPDLPLYMQVSRSGLLLHLSEHHGDASPGGTIQVPMDGIAAFHKELNDKKYGYGRPGIVKQPWGDEMTVHDPFGNRIRFLAAR
jgi:hypothetical protein